MREFLDKYYVVKALLALLFFEISNLSMRLFCDAVGINFVTNADFFIREMLFKVAPIVGAAVIFKATGSMKHFSFKSFFKSLLSGLFFYILCGGVLLIILLVQGTDGETFKSAPEIILYILFVLGVGFSEELLFRGVIPDILRGNEIGTEGISRSRRVLAAVLSSLLFGFVHITNIFNGRSSGRSTEEREVA